MEEKKGFWRTFNPTVKEKMEQNPNLTVMGIVWAGYWRFTVIVLACEFILVILAIGFVFLVGMSGR